MGYSINFDKTSTIYDTSRYAIPEKVEKLISCLGLSSDSIVLDLGCGTGNFAKALNPRVKTIIGIDISSGMLRKAIPKSKGFPLVRGNVEYLPFESGTFDCAFAVQVLHHVEHKGLFLKEVYRALKHGGSFALDSCSHMQMKTFWFYHYFPEALKQDLTRIPDCSKIVSLLEKAGFNNVRVEISYSDIASEHLKPENYLNKDYRDGMSTFQLLDERAVEHGCAVLKGDIMSGEVTHIIGKYAKEEVVLGGSSIVFGKT